MQPQQPLHLISDFDGYGLSRQLELLVWHQLRRGMKPTVLALRGDRKLVRWLGQQGLSIRTLDRRWVRDPFVAARLVAALRRREYDLLHLWGQSAVNYARAIENFAPRVPRLTSLLNDQLLIGISTPPTAGISREKFLAEQLLPADAKLIAVAGPLVRSQQIDEAIWHFELIRTLDENVRLMIFGDGPDRHRLERFTRLTSEPSAVRFLGYRRDFRELLSHVDIFWHTAEASEALPQSVLEAMAAGLPVVVNETANCRKIVDHGNTGYLVPGNGRAVFARYTRNLFEDLDHAREVGMSAIVDIAERFSVDDTLDEYARRYAEAREDRSRQKMQNR